jgi:hypothetical protein
METGSSVFSCGFRGLGKKSDDKPKKQSDDEPKKHMRIEKGAPCQ